MPITWWCSHQGKCFFGQYLAPFITTPTFGPAADRADNFHPTWLSAANCTVDKHRARLCGHMDASPTAMIKVDTCTNMFPSAPPIPSAIDPAADCPALIHGDALRGILQAEEVRGSPVKLGTVRKISPFSQHKQSLLRLFCSNSTAFVLAALQSKFDAWAMPNVLGISVGAG